MVQFLYGEDGMDGVWVEKQRFDILLMSKKDFRKAYEIDVNHAKFGFSQHIAGQRYLAREVWFGCGVCWNVATVDWFCWLVGWLDENWKLREVGLSLRKPQ